MSKVAAIADRFFSSLPTSCIAGPCPLPVCSPRRPVLLVPTDELHCGIARTSDLWYSRPVLLVPTDELHCGADVHVVGVNSLAAGVLLVPTDELHCGVSTVATGAPTVTEFFSSLPTSCIAGWLPRFTSS